MLSDTLKLLLPEMRAAQQTAAAQACYVKYVTKPGFIIFHLLKVTEYPKYNYIISNTISTAQAYYQQKHITT